MAGEEESGQPLSEADLQRHFRVTPPSVHQMVVTLDKRGLIAWVPGQPRTIRVLLPPEVLPDLIQPSCRPNTPG